jgi:hypothetical protein
MTTKDWALSIGLLVAIPLVLLALLVFIWRRCRAAKNK